jgi:hypothetical protein
MLPHYMLEKKEQLWQAKEIKFIHNKSRRIVDTGLKINIAGKSILLQ